MDIYSFLAQHNISYQRFDHPPVFTCEEAMKLVPKSNGKDTKNLFLRDKKGKRHFLVVVGYEKTVNLKSLSEELAVSGLSLASPERLKKYLGVEPGSVSILAVINDKERAVEVILDLAVWNAETICCHPLVNTSTLVIGIQSIKRIFTETRNSVRVIDVPGVTS